jgi:hypothetical protein
MRGPSAVVRTRTQGSRVAAPAAVAFGIRACCRLNSSTRLGVIFAMAPFLGRRPWYPPNGFLVRRISAIYRSTNWPARCVIAPTEAARAWSKVRSFMSRRTEEIPSGWPCCCPVRTSQLTGVSASLQARLALHAGTSFTKDQSLYRARTRSGLRSCRRSRYRVFGCARAGSQSLWNG